MEIWKAKSQDTPKENKLGGKYLPDINLLKSYNK